ncbi:MAG: hypothetical protein LBP58_03030 [Azoarcus sp.]|nr:hypothetical protein [Azoarcus sp.]
MAVIDLSALVRERLGKHPLTRETLRQIGGASDLPEARRALRATPAAFVFPLAESVSGPLFAGNFRQVKELHVAVVTVAPDARQGVGGTRGTGIDMARNLVETALIGENGWMPEGCSDVLAWAGGRLAVVDNGGFVWWQDDYATRQIVMTPV